MNAPQTVKNPRSGKRRAPNPSADKTSTGLAACLDCRNRKVRCNRESPKCSNCQKSGGPCEYPDPEKKASQTKQLAEDVVAVNGRLSDIEQNFSNQMQALTNMVSHSVRDSTGSGYHSSKSSPEATDDLYSSDLDEEPAIRTPDSAGTGARTPSIIVRDGHVERFYGHLSTYSHLVNSRRLVERILVSGKQESPTETPRRSHSLNDVPRQAESMAADSTFFAEVQRRYDSFSGTSKFRESFEIGDDKALELPPRGELEDAIELYLSEYSLEPSIFERKTLMDAVSEKYNGNRYDVDQSWVLCFNNIILRSSAWRSRTFRINAFTMHSGGDENVLSLLLANANRALRQLERFCLPRVVNIQALYLLALIARDSIHFNVFERIFDRACQLAKQMGLHEQGLLGGDPSIDDQTRQNLLWVLYSVDKQRIFIRGPPCRIYLFECHIQFPRADDAKQQLISANLRLSCLIEEIYRYLYSPKASRQDPRALQKRVGQLESRLERWARQADNLLSTAERGSNVKQSMSLQLRYAWFVAKLLIYNKNLGEHVKGLRLETARKALQIIRRLSGGSFVYSGYVEVLERIFCCYSVVAFHEVFDNLLLNRTTYDGDDVSLLTAATNALRLLAHPDKPFSYCTRLHKNFTWCNEIATLIHNARKLEIPISSGPTSGSLDSIGSGPFDTFNFSPRDLSAPSATISPQQAHDFDADLRMGDNSHHLSKTRSGPDPLSSGSSAFDSSESNAFQNCLHPDMFHTGDLVPPTHSFTDLLGQTTAIPPESSAQFQDALKWVFDKGSDLDSNFQQMMTSQSMPLMPPSGNEATTYGA